MWIHILLFVDGQVERKGSMKTNSLCAWTETSIFFTRLFCFFGGLRETWEPWTECPSVSASHSSSESYRFGPDLIPLAPEIFQAFGITQDYTNGFLVLQFAGGWSLDFSASIPMSTCSQYIFPAVLFLCTMQITSFPYLLPVSGGSNPCVP